jgi:Cys-tRNA(Pro)/Cys-tRNA(Cys) deacylase
LFFANLAMSVYDNVVQRLDESGIAYRMHEHAPSVTVLDAETHLDFPVNQLLKTIAFRVKQGGWVLAALCGYRQVDYKKLAAVCGVSRDKLMRLTPEQVEQDLGFELGGVCPFAPNPQTRVVIDAGALQYGLIFCGTGRRDRTLEIAPVDLVRVSGATVTSLAKDSV